MIVTDEFNICGMHCGGCENIIEEALLKIDGIQYVKADYRKAKIQISFDPDKTNFKSIYDICSKLGYNFESTANNQNKTPFKIIVSTLSFAIIILIIFLTRKYGLLKIIPELNSQTTDGMIFLIGLFTGLHCIGMCGSFIIGYTARDTEFGRPIFRSHILFGLGKIFSYAFFGAIFGLLGSMFHITPLISGICIGLAGVFLILYGLNILNIFNLRFINIKLPSKLYSFLYYKKRQSNNPLIIGLFSGLILGCGPLQAMYVMVAGIGNPIIGAKILAIFGLGTLPALFSFGLLTRFLSNIMTRRFIKASGLILLVLGGMMLWKGINRSIAIEEPHAVKTKCPYCTAIIIEKTHNQVIVDFHNLKTYKLPLELSTTKVNNEQF